MLAFPYIFAKIIMLMCHLQNGIWLFRVRVTSTKSKLQNERSKVNYSDCFKYSAQQSAQRSPSTPAETIPPA